MSRWNGYGARLAALVHITRGQLVTLLLGAVWGVVVSIPAFLGVDALKREAQERAALTGFVEKLQEAEEEMAFHQSRPMVNNPINSVEEARRVGRGLHWGDATTYRRVIMSLIEYVRRSDMDVLVKRHEL